MFALLTVLLDGQRGFSPLHSAACYNQCQVADALLAAGADVNAKSNVTISCACWLLLIVLLDAQEGCTPLRIAAQNVQCQVAEVLLAAGRKCQEQCDSPLCSLAAAHCACSMDRMEKHR